MTVSQPTLESLRRWDPEQIGPYTLLGRLGAGAMGHVYLGRSTAGRLVAVKTIKIELAEEPGFRERFAREVAAARRVSGVFTAAVVAADPEADVPWLATAYVPAPSLSRLVRACGPLPVMTVRWLAAGCAEALESIHVAGLVHRDLKPSNVLVAPDGPRVIDFGVARAAGRIQLTVTRGAVGTPAYMAPEQARDSRQASLASDVYSLGATLLFAATGHAPYAGDTVMDVLVKLATEPPDLTGLPGDLDGLITACLERSPRNRPTSAALLAGLGSFAEALAGPVDAHSYLTDTAMGLIAGYQRSPQAVTPDGDADAFSDDPTSASHTALPASFTPPPGRRPARWPKPGRGRGATGGPGWQQSHGQPHGQRPRRNRTILIVAGTVCAAGVLVAGGAFLGIALRPAGAQATTSAAQPGPPPGPPAPVTTGTSGLPELKMGQPQGDGDTVFVVHGSGFTPGTHIKVLLTRDGMSRTSPVEPVVDPVGTFNYAIDQGHEFFPQRIPRGIYDVLAVGPGGRKATARFTVLPPPPPSGTPPSGQPPPLGAPHRGSGGRPAAAHRPRSSLLSMRSGRPTPRRITAPGSTRGLPAGSTRPDRSAARGRPG
jgi:serine/threonine protein kinase